MKKRSREWLEQRLRDIEEDNFRVSEEVVRRFLKRKVGRWVVAKILGGPDKPDMDKARAYLYKNLSLEDPYRMRMEECYRAALIVNEIRFYQDGVDRNVARNWLQMSCPYLEDHAPLCAIRDGRTYAHRSAVGAAKTFFLECLK